MKTANWILLIAACSLGGGCATSTVEKRKQERSAIYSALPEEQRATVDQGKIKVGMSTDAVYIAWGRPSQILSGESGHGATTTWLYHGTHLVEYRHWAFRSYCWGGRFYSSPYLDYDYYPRSYVRAQVVFENGVVKEWKSLPVPPGY